MPTRHVLALPELPEAVAEEGAAAGAEPAEVQLEARRAEHAARAVVAQVRDLDARRKPRPTWGTSIPSVAAGTQTFAALVVLHLDAELDAAPPTGRRDMPSVYFPSSTGCAGPSRETDGRTVELGSLKSRATAEKPRCGSGRYERAAVRPQRPSTYAFFEYE